MNSNRLWYLKRLNLHSVLSDDELRRLDGAAQDRSYQRRQLIFTPEDQGEHVHLLREGRVKLSRFDPRGKEITLAILEEGEFFGEEILLGESKRRAFAEALTDVKLSRIPLADFERIITENPEAAATIARQLAQRLFGAYAQIEDLAFHDVARRLAGSLVELAERHGATAAHGGILVELQLTHQELASLIASTRETTTTLLGRFRRDGWIRQEGRRILVTDLEALRRAAQGEA